MTSTLLARKIHDAVSAPTLRSDGRAEDGRVRTPRPRLALRVGLTGHRPARLLEAVARINRDAPPDRQITSAQHERWLRARLDQVFVSIQESANIALAEHAYKRDGETRGFYDRDAKPLIRLVCGLACGVDMIGLDLVNTDFRGPKLPDQRVALIPQHAISPRPFEHGQAEWQIDAILPFGLADFIREAAPDFLLSNPGLDAATAQTRFLAHWHATAGLPDTLLTLPALWRHGAPCAAEAAPSTAGAAVNHLLTKQTCDALQRAYGAFATPPELPGPDEEKGELSLDYGFAGDFMLRQIDLLVAVWDGEPARGVGGAPDLVASAVDRGLPVVYIDPDDLDAPARMALGVKRREAHSSVLGWIPLPLTPELGATDACAGALRDEIFDLLAPPQGEAVGGHGPRHARNERQRTIDLLEEDWPDRTPPRVYRSFQNFAADTSFGTIRDFFCAMTAPGSARVPDRPDPSDANWTGMINDDPDEGLQAIRLKQILHRRYLISDLLAVKYAELYRGAYIKAYLWATLAVLLALASLLLPHEDWSLTAKAALVFLEIIVIAKISRKVKRGTREAWHEKFVHYRGLAESLRHLRFLATFAEFAEAGKAARVGETAWWLWYLRATAREIGLPQGTLDADYQRSLLSVVRRYEVRDQIGYHKATSARESATDHAVHRWEGFLFTTTFVVLASAWALWFVALVYAAFHAPADELPSGFLTLIQCHGPVWFNEWVDDAKPLIGLLAAALPALGAALAGIRFTADFDGKSARSSIMAHDLERLDATFDAAMDRPEFERTRALLKETAGVMAEDVAAFLSLYGRKPLVLPA